ncbi:MAG: RagB/SusD family nutrient uptake outer membrane protein [Bacteroidota bacterium]
MKKLYFLTKILAAALFLVVLPQSCTDLEEELFDSVSQDNFFQTDDELRAGFAEAYARLRSFANHGNYFSIQEVPSDEAMIPQRGGDWFDGGLWLRVHRHEQNANESVINNVWNFAYGGINLINLLVETFEANEADAATVSELKVLRAFYYFMLLDVFGNVPIVDATTGFDKPANNTRLEVYEFVVRELTENVPNLSRNVGAMYGRFHYYAGQALLAKVYINAEVYAGKTEWVNAEAAIDEVMSGPFSLEDDYFTNFNADNDGSNEIIFGIPYDRVNLQGFNLPQMTLHYSSQSTFNLEQQPWNGYCTLQEFYNSYDDADGRKGISGDQKTRGNFIVGPQFASDGTTRLEDAGAEAGDPDGTPLTFTPEINEHFPNALRQAGARIGKYEFLDGATPELDNDFPVFRLADLMLMKAEVRWRQSAGDASALQLVNQIRARAGMPGFDALNAENLLAERGREMFAETWRRNDLIRFGVFGEAWDFKPASTADKEIFPLPQPQLDVNDNLQQNPGY